jgi:hypothetical protein
MTRVSGARDPPKTNDRLDTHLSHPATMLAEAISCITQAKA